jgi:hypothetical protein
LKLGNFPIIRARAEEGRNTTIGDGRAEHNCFNGAGSRIVVDAFPLDAVERKLMFGARKGITLTVVTWFIAHLENNLGLPPAQ